MSHNLGGRAERIESILESLHDAAYPGDARAKAEEVLRLTVELYGDGLTRVLEIVDELAGERSRDLFDALCADELVESLLILHGLHPLELEARVRKALDEVRPYLKSHEGGVEVLDIREGVVRLRMAGNCNGCPSSSATAKAAIERAIVKAAPEIREVRVEGVRESSTGLRVMSEWYALPELHANAVAPMDVEGTPALLLRAAESVQAYRNQCPACYRTLGGADLAWPHLTCASCGTRYDLTSDRLETFPATIDGGRIQLAIPVTT